jgi:hypothetical protein
MQVQDKRACKACGASNAMAAAFCWQCLARFDAAAAGMPLPAPPSGVQPGGFTRPGMPPPLNVPSGIPAAGATKRKSVSAGRVVVGIVVAAALVFFGNRIIGGPDYHVPATINGVARTTDPAATQLASSLNEEAKKYDLTIDSGIYGPSGSPDFVVIVVNGRAVESADSLFDSMIEGMVHAGVSVDGAPVTGTHEGTEFRCVLVHGQTSASACMWLDSDNVGIVLDPGSGVRETEQLLWATHDAVVG